jgi:hypothetical protein
MSITLPNGQLVETNTPTAGQNRQTMTPGDPTATTLQSFEGLSGNTYTGAAVCISPTNWSAYHTPTSATLATITQSAGSSGICHVLQGISGSYVCAATAATTAVQLSVLDGSTVKFSITFLPAANATVNFHYFDLNIAGTAATSMTVAFSGAGPAGSFQSISAYGYDIV